MVSPSVAEAVNRLSSRSKTRTEADIQADAYILLTSGALNLGTDEVVKLEKQVGDGTRRRLDIEVGRCAIEVKKDLRVGNVRAEAENQLAGYVKTQSQKLNTRYVGILTDGSEWIVYHLTGDELVAVADYTLTSKEPDVERLIVWLESVLSTQPAIPPVPAEIEERLGSESPAHRLDHATLQELYLNSEKMPTVKIKRDLWAKLLRTAFGSAFTNDEHLFIDHTLLVLTAEIIAHAVVGFDVSPNGGLDPQSLVSGSEFADSQIRGVVEEDFFDWVVEVPGGRDFVSELARRISRFDWSHVEHDVLKILYESVISQEARQSLGEYYTPDWLADRVVADALTDPLNQTALDPSCGSGTFIFHAARAYLAASDAVGVPNGEAVAGLTRHVFGMDVHPVAVTFARVTYLLAIGRARLSADDRGEISIPVFLGDSLQWEQRRDLIGGVDTITISTAGDDLVEGGGVLFGEDLVFPRSILKDANHFDKIVRVMADNALDVSGTLSRNVIEPPLKKLKVRGDDLKVLTETFDTMRKLHASGRNHIWGYYVRNLIRPIWLAEPANSVDVLIGNPPWLRYSKMTPNMQTRYKALAKDRKLLTGGLGASSRDLSTLFVVRSIELYLKSKGSFSFVMPQGILTRKPHTGFRSGNWSSANEGSLAASFDTSWDLSKATTGFPMLSCVVRGGRTTEPTAMGQKVISWTNKLQRADLPWDEVEKVTTVFETTVHALDAGVIVPSSPYKKRFRQGAILVPRALMFVNEVIASPLGAGAGRVKVTSARSNQEKSPWKETPSISATVEKRFIHPVHLGATTLPFRLQDPLTAVIPLDASHILSDSEVSTHGGLNGWWRTAEDTWKANKSPADESSLLERINYISQLSSQLPTGTTRIVYTKSGNNLTAARLSDPKVIVDHMLYWAEAVTVGEAQYLIAILNSDLVLQWVKPLQALGLYGGRHFDKNVFAIPIPMYDSTDELHARIAKLSAKAEKLAETVLIDPSWTFQKARKEVRKALALDGLTEDIELAIHELIPPIEVEPDGI